MLFVELIRRLCPLMVVFNVTPDVMLAPAELMALSNTIWEPIIFGDAAPDLTVSTSKRTLALSPFESSASTWTT